jgi:hypothetical protein
VTSSENAPKVPEKPKLTAAERRRRTQRRAWIPTVVIGGIILIAVVVAVLFQVTGLGTRLNAHGDSKFNIAGLRVVNGAADAQIDVRKPLTATSVGLPANSSRTFGPYDGISLEVDLIGTSGTKEIFVDTMQVVTRKGYVTSISTTTRDHGFLFIRTQLASLNTLGLTSKQLANFENTMPNGAGGEDSYFSIPFGTGNALGVPTSVTVSCSGPKGCAVSTKTTLLQK